MKNKRKIKDIWNAFMLEEAKFSLETDIPICPTVLNELPKEMISFSNAKIIHNKNIANGNYNYHVNSFIHFYIDDEKFDSTFESIWKKPYKALDIISHYDGMITPDFSTYRDFPDPVKRYNTYRMRTFGYWIGKQNIQVINNVRWDQDSYDYCFSGIPEGSIISIGSVASGLKRTENQVIFETGILIAIEILKPHTIIIYGSSNYAVFDSIKHSGIKVITFQSQTNLAHSKEKSNE